jgi:hypothetical protein
LHFAFERLELRDRERGRVEFLNQKRVGDFGRDEARDRGLPCTALAT